MTSKETIFQKCMCLHGVHEDIKADVLRDEIQSQHGVNVVRIEEVTGAETNRKQKRWILELEGGLSVKKLKNKSLEINTDEYSGTVDFKEPIECEVPSIWTMPQVPRNPKPTGRPYSQFNPQGPLVGQATVYQNYEAVGGYTSHMMSAAHKGASEQHFASQQGSYREEGSMEGSGQPHAQAGQGQEHMGPGNAPMAQMYGWINPGHGHMGQGHGQMPHWQGHMGHGDIHTGQGHAQRGQGHGNIDQGQGPVQMGAYETFLSMIRHDPNSGQYYFYNGYQFVPVTAEYIQQGKAYFEGQQQVLQQQQQQSGHELSPEVLPENSDADPQESDKPDTTKQKAEDLEKQNLDTVEENKSIKEPQTKVKLTHLPSGVDEEYVEMILENKKMGSLSVANVVIDYETGSAEVEMGMPEDANALIRMQTVQMKGAQVCVEWLQVTTNEPKEELNEESPPSILVTGFPEGCDEEEIRMFFENKRKFEDVQVIDVKFNEQSSSAIITYSSKNDVDRVMEMCPLKLLGTVIKCERHQCRTYRQHESPKPLEPKVLVKGLPENIDEEDVRMFFENKRKFRDVEVVEVVWNAESTSAVITYSSENDVESVLGMGPLKLMGKELIVERFGSSDAYKKPLHSHSKSYADSKFDGTQTEILVEDIPPGVDDEILEMCFSSRNLRSCKVEDIDIDEVDNNAVIKFVRPQDVKIVLDNLPITIKKKEVSVQIYVPKKLCTVIVRGPDGVMKEENEDRFEMYFENEKKSGGDTISKIEFQPKEKAFYITYKEEYVAKRVVERSDHSIIKNKVKVELFKPSRSTKVSSEQTNDGNNTIYKRNVAKEDKHGEPEFQPLTTVRIRGVRRISSRDSVQWYFENKNKAGGGEIESHFTDEEDDDVMYIKFKDESVAQTVADRKHTLDGHELEVTLYMPPVPPPSYPNKLLIQGLTSKITFSVLDLFMEAKAGLNLVHGTMTYHIDKEDTALVTVEQEIDLPKLEESCKSKLLEGSRLRFSLVPISNCVQVSNISDTVTEDMVALYFENAKRSNGGTVKKVEMFSTQNYCLVYFDDYKVVDNVLSKQQTLDSRQLEVRRYFPCIGRAEGDTVERRFKKPVPFTLKANVQKIKFLHKSVPNKEAMAKQLAMCHATVNWPPANDVEDVEICCTLSEDVKDCVKLAKDWKEVAKKSFQDFMNTLDAEHVVVVQDILKKVTEELGKLSIDNPEAVAVLLQKKENKIYVVGIKGAVTSLIKNVEQIVTEIQTASEKEKQSSKTTISTMKSIETRMLLADKFPIQIEAKYPDVKVRINQNKNEIEIEGVNSFVNKTQIEMYQIKDSYQPTEIVIPKEMADMYMNRYVKDYIVKKLKPQKVVAVWEAHDDKLKVLSKTEEMLDQAVSILKKSVSTGAVQLTPESRSILQSDLWRNLKDSLLQENQGKVKIVDNPLEDIMVVCTDDVHSSVLTKINDFLEKNTTYKTKLTFTENIHTLLNRHHLQELQEIARKKNVSLNVQGTSFEIAGTKLGIDYAKKEFESMAKKVQTKSHQVSNPGISEFMHSDKGRGLRRSVESTHPVLVKLGDEDRDEDVYSIYDTTEIRQKVPSSCAVTASCVAFEVRNIHVVFGDITDLSVDAIVNAADEKLSLCGGLGKAILRKGGDAIASDCKQYIDAHGKLGEAAVFVSTGGKLKAKSIVHIAGPVWKDGMQEEDEKLTEVVFKAMHQASGKGYKSVALPAISCGAYGYPVKRATGVIVASVKNFFREVQESELTEIYLCDMKQDTVNGFVEGLEKEFGMSSVRRLNQNKSYSAQKLAPGSLPTLDSSDEESGGSSSHYHTRTDRPQLPRRHSGMSTSQLPVQIGNISVAVEKDEIAKHNVPVIVNTTSRNLDLNNGAVSKTILKQAGPEIQNELKQKYPTGIAEGQIAVTKGYKLNCTNVIHGAVSNWDGKKTIDELNKFVTLCLTEAQKGGHSGIAFPAIGTGNLGYPKEIVASEMFKAVSDFATKNPQSPVSSVVFVLYPKDEATIQAFKNEMSNWSTGGQTGRQRDYDHYENLHSRIGEDGGEEHIYEELPSSDSGETNIFVFGNVKLTVKQGDISSEDVDCIINSSNEALDLTQGRVSQALVKLCGDKLVKQAKSMQGDMKKKGLAITQAPNLKCRHIMHVVAKETSPQWKEIVQLCLDKAKNENYKSIAFPALGTGMKMSAAQSAQVMFQALGDFVKKGCGSMTDIRFVIFQDNMVDDFKLAAKQATAKQAKTKASGVSKTSRDQPQVSSGNPNVVMLVIYGMNVKDISQAIKDIEAGVKSEIQTSAFTDTVVKRLDKVQMDAIKRAAEKNNVDLKLSSDKIEIIGMIGNVHSTSAVINRVIRDAIQIEHDTQAAKILKDVVQWYYIEFRQDTGDELMKYSEMLNFQIENAFRKQSDFFEYREGNKDVVVDFKTLQEYFKGETDETQKTKIVRKDLIKEQTAEFPKDWKDQKGNLLVHALMPADPNYVKISAEFAKTATQGLTISKIEMVQNKTLWQQYVAKKQQLEGQNPQGTVNERFLWHGTADSTVDSVNAHGFNRSYCGKNAVAYGDGVYFAVNASYSCSNTYSRPDQTGVKRMYYCCVLTGECTKGVAGMRVPPSKPAGGKNALFDSVSDNPAAPNMFIIFNDTQAYPLFIVYFK